MSNFKKWKERYLYITLLLGFSSGLPLALSGGTLQAWFSASGISLQTIGFLGLVGVPYTFKFLWAPFMDRWVPPLLGRRRGWMILCQLAVCLTLALMALFNPESDAQILFMLACVLAFLSASQDIAVDAYRTDLLKPAERPLGAAMFVNGYRVALLVAGGLTLIIAHQYGWKIAYLVMSALMLIGILASWFSPEPEVQGVPPRNLRECTIVPFVDFLSRPRALAVLIFIVCYKLGDAYAGSMCYAFLIREIHFTLLEIGSLIKLMGFIGTILGTLLGGMIMSRIGYFPALLLFGILQAIANLAYWPLLWTGADVWVAGGAIFIDNLSSGMGTVAFFALLMGLCNPRFTAFQYALFSALSSVGRVFIAPLAGMVAQNQGWEFFFFSSIAFSVPGLLLLWWLRGGLDKMREVQTAHRDNMVTVH